MKLFSIVALVAVVLLSLFFQAFAQSSGYWGGFWTWNPTTSSWYWTWVWYSGGSSWTASVADSDMPPPKADVHLSTVLGIAGGVFAGLVAVVAGVVIFIRRRRAALADAAETNPAANIPTTA